jgi:GTP-binding protein YchF
MKTGIIGLSASGKTTIFEALTGFISEPGQKGENRIGTVPVPDDRLDVLSGMFQPKKTIFAQVEYLLPGGSFQKEQTGDQNIWAPLRDTDALIHVIRNFGGYGYTPPTPLDDFITLDQDLILTDLFSVERRIQRLELDHNRGKKINQSELGLLKACQKNLENEKPLRKCADLAGDPLLKGFAFISAKPMLVLFNNEDEDDRLPQAGGLHKRETCTVIRGKLEQELAQMSAAEAADFLAEFNIGASAKDRIIRLSYDFLGLISFFTFNNDEVRAWTVKKGTPAMDAAGQIHSDMKKGFIRAEVLAYDDLASAGSYPAARKEGTVRLEGKTYPVQDGDIITFRFSV